MAAFKKRGLCIRRACIKNIQVLFMYKKHERYYTGRKIKALKQASLYIVVLKIF